MTATVLEAPPAPSEQDDDPVRVFGIRHHGPGSARSLLRALDEYQPDAVLIEGPADADPLIGWVTAEGMRPPLALLAYAADEPKVSAFWPFAVFSPEWQAMVWAVEHGVEVRFCDLPAAQVLAPQSGGRTLFDEAGHRGGGPDDPARDPLGTLAAAAGYDDPERWWEDLVESRLDSSSPFPLLVEAMGELRRHSGPPSPTERRREAYMRQTVRARPAAGPGAGRRGLRRLARAGAHLAAAAGQRRRRGAARWRQAEGDADLGAVDRAAAGQRKRVRGRDHLAGLVPPSLDRPEGTIPRWLVKVARALRERDLPASSAHVIEAVRLAETLASLRSRPLAGLTEVTEATRAVLCDGDERAVRYVTEHLVVGQALGSVNERVPTVPLEADLVRTCRSLRVRREPDLRHWDLDLRRTIDRNRSQLFHRLRLLELDWVRPADTDIASQGTFREVWASRWQPEYAVQLVEASVWGTTVESAATARVDQIRRDGTLPELTRTVGRCLLAALPAALDALLDTVAERAARDTDVVHLMEALPPLARAQRYGDVRQTDTAALARVIETLVVRTCAGLSRAVSALDAENAAAMRRRIDAVNGALGLLGPTAEPLRQRWLATLGELAARSDLHGLLQGRIVRLLTDAEVLDDAARRLQRALSAGVDAAAKAAWVEGFFADGALLLIHDPGLRDLLDAWVSGLSEAEFTDLLPLVRRTFGTFSAAERRTIAGRLSTAGARRG